MIHIASPSGSTGTFEELSAIWQEKAGPPL
jgi:hypothetical protein